MQQLPILLLQPMQDKLKPDRQELTVFKYNQLLRIEEELGDASIYPGLNAWFNLKISRLRV